MNRPEASVAVKAYVARAWPVSSMTRDGAIRKAWGESRLPNIGLEMFREMLAGEGFIPRQFGGENGPWILQFPGPGDKRLAAGFLKCEGF